MKKKKISIFIMMLLITSILIPIAHSEHDIETSDSPQLDQYQEHGGGSEEIDTYEWQDFTPSYNLFMLSSSSSLAGTIKGNGGYYCVY